ncbi:MAG: alpha/beta hydrolase [Chthoniobacteraceae bacterium]
MVTKQAAFRLWEADAPGATGICLTDIPRLTPYLPEPAHATGTSIVVLPGGGYGSLADHEGEGYAHWLAEQGIAAFVLQYRLASSGYRHPVMLQDAARALRTVRAKAECWGVDPQRIGIMGSSAGGHLASTLLTHFDAGDLKSADPIERVSSRPDFGILCYAVITMMERTHGGSRDNLLGENPSPELLELLSNEKQVTPQTPPCFVWHTGEDGSVPVENSIDFARALRANGVPFDLHIFQKGPHGIGLVDPASPHPWAADCLFWLCENGFLQS